MEMLRFCDEWPFERIIHVLARGPTRLEKKNVLAFVSKSPFAVPWPVCFSAVCLIVLPAPTKIRGVANKAKIKTQRKSLTWMLRHHCAGLAIKLCSALHWWCLSMTEDSTPLIYNLSGWITWMSPRGHVAPPAERKSSGLAAVQVGMKEFARVDYRGCCDVGHSELLLLFRIMPLYRQRYWDTCLNTWGQVFNPCRGRRCIGQSQESTESQAFLSNTNAWPHRCTLGE